MKRIFITLIMLLCISLVSAQLYDESSSVARIVGDSPEELISQLRSDPIIIDDASVLVAFDQYDQGRHLQAKRILSKEVSAVSIESISRVSEVQASFVRDDGLYVLQFTTSDGELNVPWAPIGPDDLAPTRELIDANAPLVIASGHRTGEYYPKQDSFVPSLLGEVYVAPSTIGNRDFDRSFLCSLRNGITLGEAYSNARVFHYTGGSRATVVNPASIVLQSMQLYGNPSRKLIMPSHEGAAALASLCSEFYRNDDHAPVLLETVNGVERYEKSFSYTIDAHAIVSEENFTTVNITDGILDRIPGEPMLPVSIRRSPLPELLSIQSVELTSMSDPVTLSLDDIGVYTASGARELSCPTNLTAGVTFDRAFEDTQKLVAIVQPFTIDDCEQGTVTLYRRFDYTIEYVSESPLIIEDIATSNADGVLAINATLKRFAYDTQRINVTIERDGEPIYAGNTSADSPYVSARVPDETGTYRIVLNASDFVEERSFTHRTSEPFADALLPVPYLGGSITIDVTVPSGEPADVFTHIFSGDEPVESLSGSITGSGNIPFTFSALEQGRDYLLITELLVDGEVYTTSEAIVTDLAPELEAAFEPRMDHEPLVIRRVASDAEGAVTVTINDSRFIEMPGGYVLDALLVTPGRTSVELIADDGRTTTVRRITTDVQEPRPAVNLTLSDASVSPNGTVDVEGTVCCTEGYCSELLVTLEDRNVTEYSFETDEAWTTSWQRVAGGRCGDSSLASTTDESFTLPTDAGDIDALTFELRQSGSPLRLVVNGVALEPQLIEPSGNGWYAYRYDLTNLSGSIEFGGEGSYELDCVEAISSTPVPEVGPLEASNPLVIEPATCEQFSWTVSTNEPAGTNHTLGFVVEDSGVIAVSASATLSVADGPLPPRIESIVAGPEDAIFGDALWCDVLVSDVDGGELEIALMDYQTTLETRWVQPVAGQVERISFNAQPAIGTVVRCDAKLMEYGGAPPIDQATSNTITIGSPGAQVTVSLTSPTDGATFAPNASMNVSTEVCCLYDSCSFMHEFLEYDNFYYSVLDTLEPDQCRSYSDVKSTYATDGERSVIARVIMDNTVHSDSVSYWVERTPSITSVDLGPKGALPDDELWCDVLAYGEVEVMLGDGQSTLGSAWAYIDNGYTHRFNFTDVQLNAGSTVTCTATVSANGGGPILDEMNDSIIVGGSPHVTVEITAPLNGSTIEHGSSFSRNATVCCYDGTCSYGLSFFQNDGSASSIAEDSLSSGSCSSYAWDGVASNVGDYELTARVVMGNNVTTDTVDYSVLEGSGLSLSVISPTQDETIFVGEPLNRTVEACCSGGFCGFSLEIEDSGLGSEPFSSQLSEGQCRTFTWSDPPTNASDFFVSASATMGEDTFTSGSVSYSALERPSLSLEVYAPPTTMEGAPLERALEACCTGSTCTFDLALDDTSGVTHATSDTLAVSTCSVYSWTDPAPAAGTYELSATATIDNEIFADGPVSYVVEPSMTEGTFTFETDAQGWEGGAVSNGAYGTSSDYAMLTSPDLGLSALDAYTVSFDVNTAAGHNARLSIGGDRWVVSPWYVYLERSKQGLVVKAYDGRYHTIARKVTDRFTIDVAVDRISGCAIVSLGPDSSEFCGVSLDRDHVNWNTGTGGAFALEEVRVATAPGAEPTLALSVGALGTVEPGAPVTRSVDACCSGDQCTFDLELVDTGTGTYTASGTLAPDACMTYAWDGLAPASDGTYEMIATASMNGSTYASDPVSYSVASDPSLSLSIVSPVVGSSYLTTDQITRSVEACCSGALCGFSLSLSDTGGVSYDANDQLDAGVCRTYSWTDPAPSAGSYVVSASATLDGQPVAASEISYAVNEPASSDVVFTFETDAQGWEGGVVSNGGYESTNDWSMLTSPDLSLSSFDAYTVSMDIITNGGSNAKLSIGTDRWVTDQWHVYLTRSSEGFSVNVYNGTYHYLAGWFDTSATITVEVDRTNGCAIVTVDAEGQRASDTYCGLEAADNYVNWNIGSGGVFRLEEVRIDEGATSAPEPSLLLTVGELGTVAPNEPVTRSVEACCFDADCSFDLALEDSGTGTYTASDVLVADACSTYSWQDSAPSVQGSYELVASALMDGSSYASDQVSYSVASDPSLSLSIVSPVVGSSYLTTDQITRSVEACCSGALCGFSLSLSDTGGVSYDANDQLDAGVCRTYSWTDPAPSAGSYVVSASATLDGQPVAASEISYAVNEPASSDVVFTFDNDDEGWEGGVVSNGAYGTSSDYAMLTSPDLGLSALDAYAVSFDVNTAAGHNARLSIGGDRWVVSPWYVYLERSKQGLVVKAYDGRYHTIARKVTDRFTIDVSVDAGCATVSVDGTSEEFCGVSLDGDYVNWNTGTGGAFALEELRLS